MAANEILPLEGITGEMTQVKRIVLNVVATYARSLYALVIGIFTSRWLLMSLGEEDYGLFGVVGGLIGFVSFLNVFLSGSIGRFYALAVGQSMVPGHENDGLEECRRWFSLAVAIHAVAPALLVLAGYPLGVWAVENFLNIPPDKIAVCVWIFRFTCFSCVINMVSVPFSAMYTAKQEIAELTIYGFVQTTATFAFIAWMVMHPGEWLFKYALASFIIANVPQLIIMARAAFCYQECRFRWRYCRDVHGLLQLISFSGFQSISTFGIMLSGQGVAIVVNKYFGAAINASMAIANSVKNHANSLSGSLVQAFMPAITNECGKGDLEKMRRYAFQACKYGMILVLVFIVPLAMEIEYIINLWLKNPPPFVPFFCLCVLYTMLVDKSVCGHHAAIMAMGRIAGYQICNGIALGLIFPMAWAFTACGLGAWGIGLSFVVDGTIYSLSRLYFARKNSKMSVRFWLIKVMLPVMMTSVVAAGAAVLPRLWMEPAFLRLCLTTSVFEVVFLSVTVFWVLDHEERYSLLTMIRKLAAKL